MDVAVFVVAYVDVEVQCYWFVHWVYVVCSVIDVTGVVGGLLVVVVVVVGVHV